MKGDEGHFYGAPEEATMLVIDNNKRKYFVEISPTPGARYWGVYGGSGIWGEGVYRSQFLCMAKRYIVDIEGQATKECTDPTVALITERGSRYGKFEDGVSFRVFNNRIDAWAHLIEHDNGPDARVAQIEIKIIEESGRIS